MILHYLQHAPFEGPGYLDEWAKKKNFQTTITRLYEPYFRFPQLGEFDVLIILGGPMSVHDGEELPWLNAEQYFIREVIQAEKKVLGICLGAQLIAMCLGATVKSAVHREIGWHAVYPTVSCFQDPWFYNLFIKYPLVFHWHGEQFELPEGSKHLLYSKANLNQAFKIGDRILALQFHLEVNAESIDAMLENCRDELLPGKYIQSSDEIQKGIKFCHNINRIADNILEHFLLCESFNGDWGHLA